MHVTTSDYAIKAPTRKMRPRFASASAPAARLGRPGLTVWNSNIPMELTPKTSRKNIQKHLCNSPDGSDRPRRQPNARRPRRELTRCVGAIFYWDISRWDRRLGASLWAFRAYISVHLQIVRKPTGIQNISAQLNNPQKIKHNKTGWRHL